jgi:GNAT superfamily N-acetyltransferase
MSETAWIVEYTMPHFGDVTIERIPRRTATLEMGHTYLGLLASATAAQYEGVGATSALLKPLEPGTCEREFDIANPAKVRNFAEDIERSMQRRYPAQWWQASGRGHVLGIAKAAPQPRMNVLGFNMRSAPNMRVEMLAVLPEVQGQHIGSAMLHAMTQFGGFDRSSHLLFNAVDVDRKVAMWRTKLGLTTFSSVSSLQVDTVSLSQTVWKSQDSLQEIGGHLVQMDRSFASASPHYVS